MIQQFDAHAENITSICFHPQNNYLMSTALDSKIKIWNLVKSELDYTLYGHNGVVNACSFSKRGDFFLTGGSDSMAMIWKTNLEKHQSEQIPALESLKNCIHTKSKSSNMASLKNTSSIEVMKEPPDMRENIASQT